MADGRVVIDVILDDGTVAKGVANVDRSLGGLGQAAKRTATRIGEIVSALGLVYLAKKGIDLVTSSLDGAIDRYDTLNQFPRVMQMIGFDASESEKAIQRLSDGIQGLPTRLDSVASTAQNIAVMTNDLDGAVETTLALNNAFLASGASTADAERGLQQYVQMLSKGEVDLQSWRTLQETMGVALNRLAEEFGYTGASAQNDLYDALKDGEITFDEFNAKLIEASEAQGGFADMASKASGGIKTAWTNFKTWIVTGVADIIAAIDEALGGTGSLEGAINNLKPVVQGVFGWIADMIPRVVEGFRAVKDAIDSWAPTISTIFDSMRQAILRAFGSLQYIVTTVIGTIKPLIIDALTAIYDFWKNNGEAMLNNAILVFDMIRITVVTVFAEIWGVIQNFLDLAVPFIQEKLAQIQQFWVNNGEQIMLAVKNAFTFIQSVVEFVMPAVQFIIQVVWEAIKDIISGALSVIQGLVEVFTGIFTGDFSMMWEGIKSIFSGAIQLIIGWMSLSLLGGIRKILMNLLKNGVKIVKNMWTSIVNFFKNFGSNAVNVATNMVTRVLNFFRNLFNQARNIFSRLRTFGASIWNSLREAVVGVARSIWQSVTQRFRNLWSSIRNTMHNVRSTVVNLWNRVMSFFRGINLFSIGKDIIRGLIRGIGSMASAVWEKAKNIAKGIGDAVKRTLGIASPAKVMIQFGKWIGEGLEEGIERSFRSLSRTSEKMADVATPDMPEFVNRLRGVRPSLGNLVPANAIAGASPITQSIKASLSYDDNEIVSLLKQIAEKDGDVYLGQEKVGSVIDREQAKRTGLYGRRLAY